MGIIIFLLAIALVVANIVGLWKIYAKAGKPGWGIFIPVWNYILYLQMAKKPLWFLVFYLAPLAVGYMLYSSVIGDIMSIQVAGASGDTSALESLDAAYFIGKYTTYIGLLSVAQIAGLVISFIVNISLAKQFGKEAGFGVGLTLLSPIFIPILGFDKNAVYQGQADEIGLDEA